MTSARARQQSSPRRKSARLLRATPKVYVGPGARMALHGSRAVLFGAYRPAWVDVLELESDATFSGENGLEAILARRFAGGPRDRWDSVGVSLSASDSKRLAARLLTELVPGDVLVTDRGVSVHVGDAWALATLVRDSVR